VSVSSKPRIEKGLLEKLPDTIKKIFNWGKSYSIWPIHYVTGCCSPEYMQLFGPRYDLERWGVLPMASARQSDAIIFVGNVTRKMMIRAIRLYEQMPEPRYVIVVGVCASSKGPFPESYSLVRVKDYLPVDMFVAGCPPKPEAQAYGILKLREMILKGEK
jgi:NADH-quinone oxidoreductase subunit B